MYIYDNSGADKYQYIAQFKFIAIGNAGKFESMDGSASINLFGDPGNFYVDVNMPLNTYFGFYKAVIGQDFVSGMTYYFSAQVIAKSAAGGGTEFADSEISAVGTKGIVIT
jgi:hypothetical protein